MRHRFRTVRRGVWAGLVLLPLAGCGKYRDMDKQPRYETFEPTAFFDDGTSARPLVEGTVDRTGGVSSRAPDKTVAPRPPLTADLLRRGQVLFDVRCTPCHGRDGYGRGMVVLRGYPPPPSFHEDRLRSIPDQHIYDVITYGLGKMPVYGNDVTPADRWAVIAYIRALQFSQQAKFADATPEAQRLLREAAANNPTTTPSAANAERSRP